MRRVNRGTPLSEHQIELKNAAHELLKGFTPSKSAYTEAAEKFNATLLEDQFRDNALSLDPKMFGREWSE